MSDTGTIENQSPEGVMHTTLVSETNLGAGTNYYPSESGKEMKGFDDLSIGVKVSGGVTVTIEVEQENSDDTPSWDDITPVGYDLITNATGAASYVDTSAVIDFDNLNVMKFRVKAITSDATNSILITSRQKRNS